MKFCNIFLYSGIPLFWLSQNTVHYTNKETRNTTWICNLSSVG